MQSPPSSSILTALETNISNDFYPSQEILEQFHKVDKLFAEFEFTKTTLSCNQLMKRFKLSTEDSISIKKLTAFSYFQCNFFYKSISIYVDLLKNFNDAEAKVYLTLFEKSTCLSHLVQDIKHFQGFKQQSLQDIAEPPTIDEDSINGSFSTTTSLQSSHSIESPLQSPDQSYYQYGCSNIFKPQPDYRTLIQLQQMLVKAKNILEIEQELIDFTQITQNTQLVQIVLMLLVLEQYNIKYNKKAVRLLSILLDRYPNNPKYKAGLAQVYVQSASLRDFELVIQNMQYKSLTDFKQNLLYGVQGLFLKNHQQFNIKFLELIALYLPQVFLEENKSAFTVTSLKDIFPYFCENLSEMLKVSAYEKFISNELTYSPNNIYLDLYFD